MKTVETDIFWTSRSRSRRPKNISLDGFQKLVSMIEKSWSRSRFLDFVSTPPSRSKYLDRDRDLSRLIEIYQKISIISRSRSNYNFHKSRSRLILLVHFTNRHLWKDGTFHSYLLVKISQKCREISKSLDKSRFVSKVSISLDDLDKYLDKVKSRLKNLDFKNLDRDKKKVDLNMKDNLDGFQKLVLTRWTFSISILSLIHI